MGSLEKQHQPNWRCYNYTVTFLFFLLTCMQPFLTTVLGGGSGQAKRLRPARGHPDGSVPGGELSEISQVCVLFIAPVRGLFASQTLQGAFEVTLWSREQARDRAQLHPPRSCPAQSSFSSNLGKRLPCGSESSSSLSRRAFRMIILSSRRVPTKKKRKYSRVTSPRKL